MKDQPVLVSHDESHLKKSMVWLEYDKISYYHEMPYFHHHNFYEIYYLMSGSKKLYYRDQFFHITKGDLVFINKAEPHRKSSIHPPSRERYLLCFNEDIIHHGQHLLADPHCPFANGSPILSLSLHDQQYVEAILEKMYNEYVGKRSHYLACIGGLLTELLTFAVRNNEQKVQQSADHNQFMHRKIAEMIQFINEHYVEHITLETLSSQFYISPYYLSRLFKSETGFTFIEYLSLVRIKEAQRLLRETEWSVVTIAETVGYGNQAHFYKVFKQFSGLSPVQFRKRSKLQK